MKMIKIALVVVILAGAGSLFFAYQLGNTKTSLKADNEKLTSEVTQKDTAAKQAQQAAVSAEQARQQAVNAAAAAGAEAQAARAELTTKQSEIDAAKAQTAEIQKQAEDTAAKLAAAQETLQKIQASTQSGPGSDVGDIGAKLAAMGDENKLLSEQLINMRDETHRLKTELAKKTETPVGVRGKVAAVEDKWSFVVLNVGQQQRVQPNSEFIVYRDTKMITKVQVLTVGPTTSVAEILPDYNLGAPRVGDMVLH